MLPKLSNQKGMKLKLSLKQQAAVFGIVLGLSASAFAAEYPKVIQTAVNQGVKVAKSFPAASGMTGWVLSKQGQYSIVFTTPDNKTLVAGLMIGESGANLSQEYAEKYIPKPDFSAVFKELEKTTMIVEGAKAPKGILYAFFDPNCPFCHMTWKALQPYEAAGLQVRWVPVAYLAPSSLPKAIEMLASVNPTSAFRVNEQNFGKEKNPPAKYTASAYPAIAKKLEENAGLMQKFGFNGTPGIVWKDKSGKIMVKNGMPKLSELPAMTGLPEQKIDDPELAKFR